MGSMMGSVKSKLLLALAFVCSLYSTTPTEWHIQEKGWDVLIEDVKKDHSYEISQDSTSEIFYDEELLQSIVLYTPLIWEIIEYEKEAGFFGYHAANYSVKIYQEILRAVFEDHLKMKIPPDFYFFRIPTELLLTREGGVKEFFQEIESNSRQDGERLTVQYLFLLPLNQELGLGLTPDHFSKEELFLLSSAVIQHFRFLTPPYTYVKDDVEYHAELFYPSHKPYQREEVLQCLYQKCPTKNSEEVGLALDKVLSLEYAIQRLGVFFDDAKIFSFFMPFNNFLENQRPRLLSLNYSLLGNANNSSSFTLGFFLGSLHNSDSESAIGFLTPLFEEIGLDTRALKEIFEEVEVRLQGQHWGCLYQFFDKSSDFKHLDAYGYVSYPGGIPYPSLVPSDVVLGNVPLYAKGEARDDYLQLRLVMTKNGVLNPNGSFKMKFYDLLDPKTSSSLNQMIHRKVQEAVIEPAKLKKYQSLLKALWSL